VIARVAAEAEVGAEPRARAEAEVEAEAEAAAKEAEVERLPRYVTDTHPLVWHLRRSRRLSSGAREIFRRADRGEAEIVLPAMVVVEVMYLAERHRIPTRLAEVIRLVRTSTNYRVQPLDEAVILEAQALPETVELHDRLIAATAKLLDAPLITKDEVLRQLSAIRCIW